MRYAAAWLVVCMEQLAYSVCRQAPQQELLLLLLRCLHLMGSTLDYTQLGAGPSNADSPPSVVFANSDPVAVAGRGAVWEPACLEHAGR